MVSELAEPGPGGRLATQADRAVQTELLSPPQAELPEPAETRQIARGERRSAPLQWLAIALCFAFGLLIILNVQMGGDAVWFWYATLLHRGVHLYSQLHLVLQPFFILETDLWMRLVGVRTIPYESLGAIHILVLCVGMCLVLRQAAWPDWQKAILLFGSFIVLIKFDAYRFDDFHVIADSLFLYGIVLVFSLERAATNRARYGLSAALGLLSGIAITNRLTDGGLLMLACAACVVVCAKPKRLSSLLIFAGVTALVWCAVVLCTGDSLRQYALYSILHAGSAKGGTGNVLMGPLVAIGQNFKAMATAYKRSFAVMSVVIAIGAIASRYWTRRTEYLVAIEVGAACIFAFVPRLSGNWHALLTGSLINTISNEVQLLAYGLTLWVLYRALRSRMRGASEPWDRREIVVLIPLATLVSAAISQANGSNNSTNTMALMILLAPALVIAAFSRPWVKASFISFVALCAICGVYYKVRRPYEWGLIQQSDMFVGRQWYMHPKYGPMYLDSNLLRLSTGICNQIGSDYGEKSSHTELLSIPFPYANYFCAVPPWHNYVQTWYDTVSPSTVATLMTQLDDAPPEWVLYQSEPGAIQAHEMEYHNNRPIPHHFLDALIVQEVSQQRWKVSERVAYAPGEAWYLMNTRSSPGTPLPLEFPPEAFATK